MIEDRPKDRPQSRFDVVTAYAFLVVFVAAWGIPFVWGVTRHLWEWAFR